MRGECFETVVEVYVPIDAVEAGALGWGTQACGADMSGLMSIHLMEGYINRRVRE